MTIHIPQTEIDSLLEQLSENNWNSILIQAAEGLIESLPQLLTHLKEYRIYIDGQPCYGACDIPNYYDTIPIDGIVHLGHNRFGFKQKLQDIPIIFLPIAIHFNSARASSIIANKLPKFWKKINLVSTVQHISILPKLKKELQKQFLGKKQFYIKNNGQILGCNYVNAKQDNNIDGIVLVAGGDFHAKQLPIHTKKPTLRYDPFTQNIHCFGRDYYTNYFKKRYATLIKAKEAKTWGILISTKIGQHNLRQERQARDLLTNFNHKIISITANTFDPQFLLNFSFVDAWVNTACPRIASDDNIRFNKPVISIEELKVVVGEKEWESVVTDF